LAISALILTAVWHMARRNAGPLTMTLLAESKDNG